jgi:hypothetical protein
MSIIQSTFDKHKKLVLEHAEKIYEGSLAQNPQFQKDQEILEKEYKELFLDPATEKTVNDAKEMPIDIFELYGGESTMKRTVEINLDSKFTIQIKIRAKPEKHDSVGHYNSREDAIAFLFYKDVANLPKAYEVNKDFDIKKFYNQNSEWVNSVIAHELSHAYKERFRSRKHSKAFINPVDVATGKKNYADYAQYDDESESYLAEIWREMLNLKKENPDLDFFSAFRNSATFNRALNAMGGEGNVKPKYKKLYYYFLKKLTELWKNAGHKIERQDINQAVELC